MTDEKPLYELRRYDLRDGAREYFDRRSRDITFPLFEKYGFSVQGFWTKIDDPLVVYYSLAWDSVGEMERSRAAMVADPMWQEMVNSPGYTPPVARNASVLLERYASVVGE